MEALFKRGRDARERIVELSSQAVDHGNNRDGNTRRDKAVLNSSSARIVVEKTQNKFVHPLAPRLPRFPNFLRI